MKYSPEDDNFYRRLALSRDNSIGEVKKAFFLAVRIHPPEKDPENYKLIRET